LEGEGQIRGARRCPSWRTSYRQQVALGRVSVAVAGLGGGLGGFGATNAEIGAALFVAEATVKTHVGGMFGKLGVRDRAAASRTTTALSRPA